MSWVNIHHWGPLGFEVVPLHPQGQVWFGKVAMQQEMQRVLSVNCTQGKTETFTVHSMFSEGLSARQQRANKIQELDSDAKANQTRLKACFFFFSKG